ncbi:TPA: TetR/AcrR family transcriptional regulator [Klebsiella michiganensis]|nr:TetR/AcrR family transcriptional regulator [Klebsiella michiganensis]HDS5558023.1 TetR/AcrR family transcriptional regulator [Klebsiella michiganensis]
MTNRYVSQPDARVSNGPQRSKESHEAILTAAETLLVEGGPAALTFESVARRARAGKSTLYRWWPNKAALLLEIYERQKSRVMNRPDLGSLREDLKVLTRGLWAFWRENNSGAAFAALLTEAQSSKDYQDVLSTYFNNHDSGLSLPCFERALARGELANGADLAVLRKAYVAMNWFHLLCGRLVDEEIDPSIDLLIDGMLSKRPNVEM